MRSTAKSSGSGFLTTGGGVSRTPSPNGNGPGYTSIAFENNTVGNRRSGIVRRTDSPVPPPSSPDGINIADILEAILRYA